jgi:hypothetical protein
MSKTKQDVTAEWSAHRECNNSDVRHAMRILTDAGYDEASRLSYLMRVERLTRDEALPYSTDSYLTP